MLYFITEIFLLSGAIHEQVTRKPLKKIYRVGWFWLVVIGSLRYGQGTDYFAYNYLYNYFGINGMFVSNVHGEIGWRALNWIFYSIGIPFEAFIAILMIIEMLVLDKFIKKYCEFPMMALFLLYPTLYLTYMFSGLRQGLGIVIFLGIGIDLLKSRKLARYASMCLILSLFHSGSLILLLIPLIIKIVSSGKNGMLIVMIALTIGLSLSVSYFRPIISDVLPHVVSQYIYRDKISIVALFERLLTFFWVLLAYFDEARWNSINRGKNVENKLFFQIYSLGVMMYSLFCFSGFVASRLMAYMKCMELPIISNLSTAKRSSNRKWIILYFLILGFAMYYRHIGALLGSTAYSDVSVFGCPYYTVFNKEEAVHLIGDNVRSYILRN